MGYLREKLATELVDDIGSISTFNFCHDFLEDGVALKYTGFSQLPQGHLVGIVADFLHLLCHHAHVEDESD